MIRINNGIVFSNDIKEILKGNNALDYNYESNNMKVDNEVVEEVRENFNEEVKKIFSDVTIISEEDMKCSLLESIKDIEGVYPHYIFG